ncbi:MAG: hypothetical protein ACKOAF_02070 [Actinomycetes bacterium]
MNTSQRPAGVRAEHDSLEGYLTGVLSDEKLARPLMVSFTQWDFAIGAIAETILTLKEMGSQPSLALWSDLTPVRDFGWQVDHRVASLLRSPSIDQRLRRALRSAGVPKQWFVEPPIRRWSPQGELPAPTVTNRTSLRALEYRNSPLGRALLQVHPDKNTPITDDHLWPTKYVKAAIESYAFVFDQTCELIKKRGITSVIVYNGRFLHDSAVAAAAEAASLPILYYDFGGLDTDFDLTIDETHDWSALQGRMLRMYENWPAEERDELGSSWFEGRIGHTDPNNALYTGTQSIGLGIESVDDRPIAVYFSSSGDEISELDLDWSEYFFGQPEALIAVSKACRAAGYTFVVRSHPHKRLKPKQDLLDWLDAVAAAAPDVHLDPYSPVDSYTLMRQADVVITYGSTTGVEAGFHGRPVIVMGPSAYDELGCATRVRTEQELLEALSGTLVSSKQGAIPYGLMMRRRGFVYRFVSRLPDGSRTLAGVPLVEAKPMVRHISHRLNRMRMSSLTRN